MGQGGNLYETMHSVMFVIELKVVVKIKCDT